MKTASCKNHPQSLRPVLLAKVRTESQSLPNGRQGSCKYYAYGDWCSAFQKKISKEACKRCKYYQVSRKKREKGITGIYKIICLKYPDEELKNLYKLCDRVNLTGCLDCEEMSYGKVKKG